MGSSRGYGDITLGEKTAWIRLSLHLLDYVLCEAVQEQSLCMFNHENISYKDEENVTYDLKVI